MGKANWGETEAIVQVTRKPVKHQEVEARTYGIGQGWSNPAPAAISEQGCVGEASHVE